MSLFVTTMATKEALRFRLYADFEAIAIVQGRFYRLREYVQDPRPRRAMNAPSREWQLGLLHRASDTVMEQWRRS